MICSPFLLLFLWCNGDEGESSLNKKKMPLLQGVTYDTGGADVKAGGVMAGMSR